MILQNIKFDNSTQMCEVTAEVEGELKKYPVTFGLIFQGCTFNLETLNHVIQSIESKKP